MTEPVMKYAAIMRAQIDSLNSIAQNASNANTVGYLQETSAMSSSQFLKILSDDSQQSGLEKMHNHALAGIHITKVNTDVGLLSDSWFAVIQNDKNLVTRNGHFRISPDGALMLGDYQVMGESGPIAGLASSDFEVRADGSIYQNKKLIDRIRLVDVDPHAQLASLGQGVYEVDLPPSDSKAGQVVQGALVGSNVNLESDMTKIIETTRHIEMLQRAMSAYDNILDTGINKIGK